MIDLRVLFGNEGLAYFSSHEDAGGWCRLPLFFPNFYDVFFLLVHIDLMEHPSLYISLHTGWKCRRMHPLH